MKKQELIAAVHQRANENRKVNKADTEAVVEALFSTIKQAFVDGEEVRVVGFGVFSTHMTKERSGRNPNTGEALVIPAHKEVRFKAASVIKDAINA